MKNAPKFAFWHKVLKNPIGALQKNFHDFLDVTFADAPIGNIKYKLAHVWGPLASLLLRF